MLVTVRSYLRYFRFNSLIRFRLSVQGHNCCTCTLHTTPSAGFRVAAQTCCFATGSACWRKLRGFARNDGGGRVSLKPSRRCNHCQRDSVSQPKPVALQQAPLAGASSGALHGMTVVGEMTKPLNGIPCRGRRCLWRLKTLARNDGGGSVSVSVSVSLKPSRRCNHCQRDSVSQP
jgi:hypothetical protein